MKNCTTKTCRLYVATFLLLSCVGCAPIDLSGKIPWLDRNSSNIPEKLVPMWKDTVLYEADKPPVRGFGARIYFYEQESPKPIKVDGTLIVYAFDADETEGLPKPKRKFVFTTEQFSKHYSKTDLGHSYSIWLPWDEVGGPSAQISLVAKFQGEKGGSVVTEPARKLLPGVDSFAEKRRDTDQPVEIENMRASYLVELSADTNTELPADHRVSREHDEQLPTITIDVPPTFSRRLRRAVQAEQPHTPEIKRSHPTSAIEASPSTPGEEINELPYQQRLSDHFEQQKWPARTVLESRPNAGPLRRQPHPGGWLSGLPQTPRSNRSETQPKP